MDLYHVWGDLKPGMGDVDFSRRIGRFLDHLAGQGLIAGWRLTRRKLGLGPPDLGEFHVMIEVRDLAQLDAAFRSVSTRRDPVEGMHHGVNAWIANARFALYRDFPDPQRHEGEERFGLTAG
ncbi:DUF6614 family protein [Zavarzinia sp. CC-PAN008]|uniref:DUF6614 family protein n=1 Tax=Zavarzinia sp. CC-PAN008 TaxID=3243332 RepID=UPI003F743684